LRGDHSTLSRAGGAPTLAVGMANILGQLWSGDAMKAFWYHYAIVFEALFILTTVDAGTRVGRFMIQDLLGSVVKPLADTASWTASLIATAICVGGWGWFLYQGVIDPLGGINSLWPLFGIANQMLAGIALCLVCVALMRMKRERFVPIALIPTLWIIVCTVTAAGYKIFSADPKIGFLAHAKKFADAAAADQLLAPAKTAAQMQQVILNDYIDVGLAVVLTSVLISIAFLSLRAGLRGWRDNAVTSQEAPFVAVGASP
jgi:carbon starvation protein